MTARFEFAGLKQCLQEAKSRAKHQQSKVLASYSLPCHRRDPLTLFATNYQYGRTVSLWGTPSSDYYSVGFGSACEFSCAPGESWSEIQTNWQKLLVSSVVIGDHQPVLCGGFAFDCQRAPSPLLKDFPPAVLTLPELPLFCEENRSYLVVNLMVEHASWQLQRVHCMVPTTRYI